jgi:hypothetical protein
VWQQHDRQQNSAESQPQPQLAQGNSSMVWRVRAPEGNGIPAAVTT